MPGDERVAIMDREARSYEHDQLARLLLITEQLEVASALLAGDSIANARAALILLDHHAEIMLHRHFLLATPDRETAYYLSPVFEGGEEPVDVEWAFHVELVNLGAGPAILDGMSLIDEATGEELVKEDWEVDWLIKADDEAQLTRLPLRDEPPGRGSLLKLKVYYRSASGNRYVTLHQIRIGTPPHAHRRSFSREPQQGNDGTTCGA